jgi:dTDP-4-dehydrorhamnose reductase
MKIAVTGPNGQLGSELVRQGGIPLRGLLMSEEMTANIEAIKPDAIINCAAMTNVDSCEENTLLAAATNAAGVKYLSYRFPGYLIQISTDYVFDGRNGPYGVRDAPNPIGFYGWSKLGGELVMHRHRGPSLIVRTTILFSAANNNFVAKIVKQLDAGKLVKMYSPDLSGTPTYVPSLAREILRIVGEGYTGLVHVAGQKTISRLDFARQIATEFGYNPGSVQPTNDKPSGAPRPMKAGLICDHSDYGNVISHNFVDGLRELANGRKT